MKLKKIISTILAFAMVISIVPAATFAAEAVHTTLYGDDFESYDVTSYPKPKPDGLTITGDSESVYVDTVGTSKRLWLKNDGFVKGVQVGKSFTQVSGKTITFELDFLQLYNTSDGDTILGIYSGDTPVVLIETNGGNITYREGTTYHSLVTGYTPNKEYSIKVELDLFAQSASVYVEDELIGSYGLLDASGTVDNFKIASKQLPGFTVDNIDIYMEESLNAVTVSGDTKPVIPVYDAVEYEYSALITDANGSAVNTATVDWSLVGAPSGVSLAGASGNKVKLVVTKDATPATFSIKAQVRDSEIAGTLSVTTENLSASKIEVVGWQDKVEYTDKTGNKSYITYPSYRITAEDREAKTYKFTARVLDQFGNEVEDFGDFTWSLFAPEGEPNVPDYVSINASSGVVTVKRNPTTEQLIGIKAVADDDTSIVGTAKVSVLDFDTYAMDKTRVDSVIRHIETALEAGSIDSTPLLSDIFVRGDKTPVRTLESNKDLIASNVMSQHNLMRAMYNLSEITENDKYKNRVDEIYKYIMTNGVMANGVMLSWGGHMTMDMETGMPSGSYNSGTHEIKGVSPFVPPMFSENVNSEYDNDVYNNGYGWGGFLFRAMVAGHAMGNYETLEFERHWSEASFATTFEPVWQTPDVFDSERRGPIQRSGGAPFTGAMGNMIDILVEYYKTTGDEYGLSWAANYMDTILNSSFTYYVYKDPDGNYIWPSDTTNMKYFATSTEVNGEEPKREYYDKNNELRYISVKSDIQPMSDTVSATSFVYEHRDVAEYDADGNLTDIVKVIDVNTGQEIELTLYNTWNNGSWAEPATMIGDHYKLDKVTANLGYQWYLHSGYKDTYGGTGYGDRFYNQIVMGTDDPTDKDTWVEQGIITEEEGSLMMDPYQRTRGIQTVGTILYAMCETIDALSDAGRTDEAIEYLEKCSKGVYNDLKQTYSFSTDTYWSYMTWIRPEYMRSNEIVEYTELAWDEELPTSVKNQMYLRADKSLNAKTHRGYYGNPGEVTFGEKRIEPAHMGSIITLCGTLREAVELLEATDPSDPNYAANMEKAELFRNRVKYFWKVLRDMFTDKAPIGDIGEDFFNLDPDLDLGTSSNNYAMVEMMVSAYKTTEHEDFLKMARAIANNYMRANYTANEQMFTNGSDYFGTVSTDVLQIFLELDALLLDRFEENIPYTSTVRGNEFYDTYLYGKDGTYRQNNTFHITPASMYANDTVKVQEVNILHDVIELEVGGSMKVNFEVIPYDASSNGVMWDVYDQRVAMMDTSTGILYGLKKGKTKIRCVSSSRTGIESKEVEVIVK